MKRQRAILYPGTLIRDKTRYFIENSNCSVGVFVNRDYKGVSNVLVVIEKDTDDFLLRYARRMLRNNLEITVQIIDLEKMNGKVTNITEGINKLVIQFGSRVKVAKLTRLYSGYLAKFSLMLISYQSWEYLVSEDIQTLKDIPSTLIINKKESRFNQKTHIPEPVIIDPEKDAEL